MFSFGFWEFGDGVFSFGFFGFFGNSGSFSIFGMWNCEILLFSAEFVLLKENLTAQGTCTSFKTTPNLPHLLRSVLQFWECGLVKYCFVL